MRSLALAARLSSYAFSLLQPEAALRPQFREQMDELRRMLFEHARAKTVGGRPVNGPMLIALAQSYVAVSSYLSRTVGVGVFVCDTDVPLSFTHCVCCCVCEQAINSGGVPNIGDAWESAARTQCDVSTLLS